MALCNCSLRFDGERVEQGMGNAGSSSAGGGTGGAGGTAGSPPAGGAGGATICDCPETQCVGDSLVSYTCVGSTCQESALLCEFDCDVDRCTLAPNGDVCDSELQCESGFCVEGVCCNTACDTECHSCLAANTSGKQGKCLPVGDGSDPYSDCGGEGCNGDTVFSYYCFNGACSGSTQQCPCGCFGSVCFGCGGNR
jgi:hypothetical protein